MFKRSIRQTEQVPHTIDGVTVMIDKTRDVPRPPVDWDTRVTVFGLVVALTLTCASVLWSTWAIGQLLHGGIGFVAAGIFDAAWLLCLLMEWLARWEPAKRARPKRAGWALLAATMVFIGWHGVESGSLGMAVAGAAVSMFAKVLWLNMMSFVNRDLSPDDLAWVRGRISQANALLAVAQVERRVARLTGQAQLTVGRPVATDQADRSTDQRPTATTTDRPATGHDQPALVTAAETLPSAPGASGPAPASEVLPVASRGHSEATADRSAPVTVATAPPVGYGFVPVATDRPTTTTGQTDRPAVATSHATNHCPGCGQDQATDRPCSERCRSRVRRRAKTGVS
ncbi:CopD family protein [Parafrankia sp. EUN1f]|uniref:CopD family protein n=1 Tax=Parafrankia sp. EUN1f TaxID=102897 RepID=UPI0001C44A79|nr:CopD family protein [Parafrankia sp. EUN1f]EFC84496.1 hypothetical protein FrEUN1fDRAFT_2426 [Parafrankia sp. EUN1f]